MSKVHRFSYRDPKPAKTAAVCRYGGIGDMIQMTSILPGLKAQGYHVTVYTTEAGRFIIRDDPHVDAWVIQDTDQVPNGELGAFWEYLSRRYDKFINLSESVEGAWLALPGRIQHSWPHNVRHKYFNQNYLQFAHDLAGVPFVPRPRFYATEDENRWARTELSRICAGNGRTKADGFVVLWSLSGSSVHKSWPHLDAIIARLMLEFKQVSVVLVGDFACQILERGWEKEPRVWLRSGKWGVRESLAFAQHADLVIGTETGLLNAVGFEDVPKIITLSHSSEENLTRDWKNTTTLTPVDTACWPCHQMHYGWKYCHQDMEESPIMGAAICQKNIPADAMWSAVKYWIDRSYNDMKAA